MRKFGWEGFEASALSSRESARCEGVRRSRRRSSVIGERMPESLGGGQPTYRLRALRALRVFSAAAVALPTRARLRLNALLRGF